MSRIRVHELARELGRQNKEIIECLKAGGIQVRSHMSPLEESQVMMVKEKYKQMGKEPIAKVDTTKTEEKMVAAKPEADKAEAPKKKKNIIRVYHAQNASDGGKNRNKRTQGERRNTQRTGEGAPSKDRVQRGKVQGGAKPAEKARPAQSQDRKPAENHGAPVQKNTQD